MSASTSLTGYEGKALGEGGSGQSCWEADMPRLQQALLTSGLTRSRTPNGNVYLMNLIEAALGALVLAKVGSNKTSSQTQDIALLLCAAVFLFQQSFVEMTPMAIIQVKYRSEELAKIVIHEGLDYLVNPHLLGIWYRIRYFRSPYRYFHYKLKGALRQARLGPPENLIAEARELLANLTDVPDANPTSGTAFAAGR
ncbi:hypothetical protein L218DRAFT_1001921 [Marasmius fiardii PR-910]|nr:hypothetical protein L218DRAFT_1001921 [Marasmius fiardii PR-910]